MSSLVRLEELLAERATQGLPPAADRELDGLLERHPGVDPEGFDLAAAAIDLALVPAEEPMPAHVREAVLARVHLELSDRSPAAARADLPAAASLRPVTDIASARAAKQPRPVKKRPAWAPWLAAAALLVALIGWWPRLASLAPAGPVAPVPTLESVAQAADAIRRPWSGTEDPAVGEAGGEVVWSGAEQRGFMRIRGLAANDPSKTQYQLWIFDRTQDERYPVDGGVFDMPAGAAEALIPIDAKIAVDEPFLFAVTVEPPGGVVVSSRERIVLLAEV